METVPSSLGSGCGGGGGCGHVLFLDDSSAVVSWRHPVDSKLETHLWERANADKDGVGASWQHRGIFCCE